MKEAELTHPDMTPRRMKVLTFALLNHSPLLPDYYREGFGDQTLAWLMSHEYLEGVSDPYPRLRLTLKGSLLASMQFPLVVVPEKKF